MSSTNLYVGRRNPQAILRPASFPKAGRSFLFLCATDGQKYIGKNTLFTGGDCKDNRMFRHRRRHRSLLSFRGTGLHCLQRGRKNQRSAPEPGHPGCGYRRYCGYYRRYFLHLRLQRRILRQPFQRAAESVSGKIPSPGTVLPFKRRH